MRRQTNSPAQKRQKRAALQPRAHWRSLASSCFSEHEEFISSGDEEYGVYNLFFQLRGQLAEAVSRGDAEASTKILDFAGRCVANQLASDGEDISVAAGVALFEHIFEDSSAKNWPAIFSAMPHAVFLACRPYAERWMGPETFSKVDEAAKKYYG